MPGPAHSRPPPRQRPDTNDRLRLRGLPPVSQPAFALGHLYFEIVYTPLLGPTAVLLARAMARHLHAAGGPTTVCPVELAHEIGIRASSSDPLGRRSHLVHALDRLAHDRIITHLDHHVLGVHLAVPALAARHLDRLPATARHAHQRLIAGPGR